MKNKFKSIALAISIFGIGLLSLSSCEMITFTINYKADDFGYIVGVPSQKVKRLDSTSEVTAIPKEGYEFVKWDDGYDQPNRHEDNVESNFTYSAVFKAITYITISYSTTEGGYIVGEASQRLLFGETPAAVEAKAEPGYRFVSWSDGFDQAPRQEPAATANMDLVATFEKIDYVTVNYDAENGYVSGKTPQTIEKGRSTESVTAVPRDGYRFLRWSDGLTTAVRSDSDVQADAHYTAYFESVTYITITYEAGEGGYIVGDTVQTVIWGESGTQVEAIPLPGYHFVSWSDGWNQAPRKDPSFTTSGTLTASFELD